MNQAQAQKIARNLQHISPVGKRIYNMIKQSHLTKADIRKRTSFPAKQIDDELNQLASLNLIKSVKADKKNIKTWMLFYQKQEQQQQQIKTQNQDLISLILKKNNTLANLKKQAIKHAYSLEKFQDIVEMLKMKGEILVVGDQVRLRKLGKLGVPCIQCELRRLCAPGNTINPENCPYLISW